MLMALTVAVAACQCSPRCDCRDHEHPELRSGPGGPNSKRVDQISFCNMTDDVVQDVKILLYEGGSEPWTHPWAQAHGVGLDNGQPDWPTVAAGKWVMRGLSHLDEDNPDPAISSGVTRAVCRVPGVPECEIMVVAPQRLQGVCFWLVELPHAVGGTPQRMLIGHAYTNYGRTWLYER
jgi:hypothetical protein